MTLHTKLLYLDSKMIVEYALDGATYICSSPSIISKVPAILPNKWQIVRNIKSWTDL